MKAQDSSLGFLLVQKFDTTRSNATVDDPSVFATFFRSFNEAKGFETDTGMTGGRSS